MIYLFVSNTDDNHFDDAVTICYTQKIGNEENVLAYSHINKPDIFYHGYNDVIRNSYCDNSYYPLYGGTWRVLNIDKDGKNTGTTRFETDAVRDDTIINNIKYLKLKRNGQLYAAIRDDRDNGKWYVSPDFEHEYLMYDFSVKPGEYVNVLLDIESSEGKLTECVVASVEEINGRRHIELLGTNGNGGLLSATKRETWIEGVGSLAGITRSNLLRQNGAVIDSLLCFTTHRTYEQEYYATINGSNCDNIKDGVPMTEGKNTRIIIEKSILKIESDFEIRDIVIYDLQGRQIMQSEKPVVDISPLSSGLYLVMVQTEKGIWNEKFVR